MSVATNLITQLTSEGYHTLQVPQFSIDLNGPGTDHTDLSDDYVIPVKSVSCYKQRIAIGREQGFMYMSRKGFNHYLNDIKASFSSSRGTWQEFLAYAKDELDTIEAESRKALVKLQALNATSPTAFSLAKENELVKYLTRM